eukprot:SAG22_NODE_1064_length_5756_cov_48.259502_6_plen_101_part_00
MITAFKETMSVEPPGKAVAYSSYARYSLALCCDALFSSSGTQSEPRARVGKRRLTCTASAAAAAANAWRSAAAASAAATLSSSCCSWTCAAPASAASASC